MLSHLSAIWDSRRSRVPRKSPRVLQQGTHLRDWTGDEGLVVEYNVRPPFWIQDNDDEGHQYRVGGYRKWIKLSFSEDHQEWEQFSSTTQFPVTVRFPAGLVLSCMKKTTPFAAMCYAREYCTRRGEHLRDFLHRSPRPEDHYVFIEPWGRRLAEELRVAWELETITIV
ncbi:hypothetical protein DHEL01_v205907 [Diaporthe helianthi]|uniref:Uncharacterized protein n=1 Tax=Diaporthe helianthi TaxID=158607 RepID=A0A2P5HZJ3_DIAHE|nr:hypothetical protein DHEL01_v205907 [Diaporthe helianthi]